MLLALESHRPVLIAALTAKSAELDAAKEALAAATAAASAAEAASARNAADAAALMRKLETGEEAAIAETTALADKEDALKAEVDDLTQQVREASAHARAARKTAQARTQRRWRRWLRRAYARVCLLPVAAAAVVVVVVESSSRARRHGATLVQSSFILLASPVVRSSTPYGAHA